LINKLVAFVCDPSGVLRLPVSANSTVKGKVSVAVLHVPLLQVLVMVLSVMLVLEPVVRLSVADPVVPNGEQFVLIPLRPVGKGPPLTHHSYAATPAVPAPKPPAAVYVGVPPTHPYVRPTTPGSKAVFGVPFVVWLNVTPKAASTIKLSVCVLPASVPVVAAGVDALATSTAATIGFVVPLDAVIALVAEHVSVGLLVLQEIGLGKLAWVGNVYPPTAPRPPAAVYFMAAQAPPPPVHPLAAEP
jgi:hypothetical protein